MNRYPFIQLLEGLKMSPLGGAGRCSGQKVHPLHLLHKLVIGHLHSRLREVPRTLHVVPSSASLPRTIHPLRLPALVGHCITTPAALDTAVGVHLLNVLLRGCCCCSTFVFHRFVQQNRPPFFRLRPASNLLCRY